MSVQLSHSTMEWPLSQVSCIQAAKIRWFLIWLQSSLVLNVLWDNDYLSSSVRYVWHSVWLARDTSESGSWNVLLLEWLVDRLVQRSNSLLRWTALVTSTSHLVILHVMFLGDVRCGGSSPLVMEVFHSTTTPFLFSSSLILSD